MRLPLQTARPLWAQYRQIACCTNRGNTAGNAGLKARASIRSATASNDLGAAAWPVAGRAIGVVGVEPVQDAGAVQKVVNEGVDGDHAGADLMPEPQLFWRSEQEGRQGHGQHLVGDAVDFAQRRDEGVSHAGQPVRTSRAVCRLQPLVDPADQIAIGNVANEQVQRIGGLVQVAVAQVMGRQRTAADVIGLGAGSAELGVAAAVEMPVALELGASGALGKFLVDIVPPSHSRAAPCSRRRSDPRCLGS